MQTKVTVNGTPSPGHNVMVVDTKTKLMTNRLIGLTKSHDYRYHNFLESL